MALRVVLHPYYKLAYIKLAWGGTEEQAAEKAAGNLYAKKLAGLLGNIARDLLLIVHIQILIYSSLPLYSSSPHVHSFRQLLEFLLEHLCSLVALPCG